MTFALNIQQARWRAHCERVFSDYQAVGAQVVPVIKSNGYGLGQHLLAQEAQRLGATSIAVGTIYEARDLVSEFAGDIIVLEPFQPRDLEAVAVWQELEQRENVVATIADSAGATAWQSNRRVMIELASDMGRFGWDSGSTIPAVNAVGLSMHLPMRPTSVDLQALAQKVGVGQLLSLSHLSAREASKLASQVPLSIRLGTSLWLGDRAALQASGRVLEVRVSNGSRLGYQLQRGRSARSYAVVSGGTAHGIGLEAPAVMSSARARAVAVAKGLIAASGKVRSPFWLGEQKLDFVEPPHQQVSMVWLPKNSDVKVGDQLNAEVRYTTTRADVVNWLP